MSENAWRSVIDIDLHGTFNCCQAALAGLKASPGGGRIINITVPQALSGWPGSAHAASAKAGVLSLTRSLAVEWGGYGIRVNNVLPGPIAGTEGLKRLYEDRGVADREIERMALGSFGLVDDIANACAFLASAGGDFVTGCDFMVDGGALAEARLGVADAARQAIRLLPERSSPGIRQADRFCHAASCSSQCQPRCRRLRVAMGLRPGDAVAILMRNDIAFLEASLAAIDMGALCRADQLACHALRRSHTSSKDSGARVLWSLIPICWRRSERSMSRASSRLSVKTPPICSEPIG